MQTLQELVPSESQLTLTRLLAAIDSARQQDFRPFDKRVLDLFGDLSRTLLSPQASAQRRPELTALGYFLRRRALERMGRDLTAGASPGVLPVPRGVALHFPPANVDTVFMYSLVLSALAGNVNVVRLSTQAGGIGRDLCALLRCTLAKPEHGGVAGLITIVSYEIDDEITAALSAVADIRVLWGGDESIRTIRQLGLPPHATELTFPDRVSLCAIRAERYLELDDAGRVELANRFFGDAYWFDQLACSSPHTLVWVGPFGMAEVASRDFTQRLLGVIEARAYKTGNVEAIDKMVVGGGAVLEGLASKVEWHSNELVSIRTDRLDAAHENRAGGGFFFQVFAEELTSLADTTTRREQTLSYFGFGRDELTEFATAVNGKGIDRIVPLGRALEFSRFWDGNDLLASFARWVLVQ